MCGLTGFWDKNKSSIKNDEVIKKMAQAIAHRGPDDEGFFFNESGIAFAHKRLSIIDLSANGHQPMNSHDGRFTMVYNGEIYNYIELAKQLANEGVKFKGNSDSEVLLECYRQYGEKCVSLFNGMFAFVIWDNETKEMFVARDRFGIKPFYYFNNDELFVFGSEIKAITAHPKIQVKANHEAIENYLCFSHQIDNQTWYKDIFHLEPGHTLKIKKTTINKVCYWKPVVAIDYSRSYQSFKNELTECIIDAIKLHQRSDLPIGSHLSGGIDSSAIVAIASQLTAQPFHTFSSTFEGIGIQFDENKEINEVKQKFGTIHHQISANPEKVIDILPKLLKILDEPTAGPAVIPMFFVNQLINENNIRVVNGGQGVDELFGGYIPFYTAAAQNLIEMLMQRISAPFSELRHIPSYFIKGGSFKRFYQKTVINPHSIFKDLDSPKRAHMRYAKVASSQQPGIFKFEENMLMSLKHYLPALLQQEDRMSMAWSIESRVPFLDYRIVELSLKIPSYYKVNGGVLKSIFRESLRGIVPELILDNKIKRGYPTPISVWSKNQMADFYKTHLTNVIGEVNEIINLRDVELMLDEHLSGKDDHTYTLWSVLCTVLWFKNNFG